MHRTWARMSPLSTPFTCPLRSMFIVSKPANVRCAVSKAKKPRPGLVRRLMKRWRGLSRLFRYLTWRSSQSAAKCSSAFKVSIQVGGILVDVDDARLDGVRGTQRFFKEGCRGLGVALGIEPEIERVTVAVQ